MSRQDPGDLVPGLALPIAVRRGRVAFVARRPPFLVIPLAAITEIAGIVSLVVGATTGWWGGSSGWFLVVAPVVALLFTRLLLRPTLELTRDGLLQRQYPFSSLTRWDVIASVGIARAGHRVLLGYKLVSGIPPPRRQPAAELLRAAGTSYDGGYFADALVGKPADVLAVVERYRRDPALRQTLPLARR